MNFRADRAREMTQAFVDKDFDGFDRGSRADISEFVMLTQYADTLEAPSAFPPEPLNNVLGEWLAKHDKTQLRISETEKYAHVTFFSAADASRNLKAKSVFLFLHLKLKPTIYSLR